MSFSLPYLADRTQRAFLRTIIDLSPFLPSQVDSLLGFLFQPTFYSSSKKLVVHQPPSSTSSGASYDSADDTIVLPGTAVVGPWLSNNGVNVVSTLVVAGVAGWYSWL